MMAFDDMFGGLPTWQTAAAFSSVAVLTTWAAVAWWSIRRAAACRPHAVEHRAWTYCPRCGWPRPADGSLPLPDPETRPIRDAIMVAGASTTDMRLLPSTLLRRGWTRAAALDAEGRIVTPCHSSAIAYSIWGAADCAFDPDGEPWREWFRNLTDILDERHGGMTMQRWNREARRTHSEVLAVAVEIERRMGLGSSFA